MDVSRSVSRTKHSADPGPGEAVRIATIYSALFFLMGLHLPYWPVWLEARGMSADEVGVLLGLGMWVRAVWNPFVGRWIDRGARASAVLRGLTALGIVSLFAFDFAHDFFALAILSVLFGIAFAPVMPLVDGQAVGAAARGRLDYGRVRSWGSAAFIAASLFGGALLEGRPEDLILWCLLAASVALFASSFVLPRSPARARGVGPGPRLRELARRPGVMLMLVTTAALQGGHAVLYAFGTTWWRRIGIDESTIGMLWAESVLVEIALFGIGARLIARFGAAGLLALSGIGGLVRWPLLAIATSLPALFAIQSLHALTFAAMHLGAMTWIRDNVEDAAIHRATALYTAVAGGIALGVGLPAAGLLYESFAGDAYHAMAAASGLGLVLSLRLISVKSISGAEPRPASE